MLDLENLRVDYQHAPIEQFDLAEPVLEAMDIEGHEAGGMVPPVKQDNAPRDLGEQAPGQQENELIPNFNVDIEPVRRRRGRPARPAVEQQQRPVDVPANLPRAENIGPVLRCRGQLALNEPTRRARGRPRRPIAAAIVEPVRNLRGPAAPVVLHRLRQRGNATGHATRATENPLHRLRIRAHQRVAVQNNVEDFNQVQRDIVTHRNECSVCTLNTINRVFIPCGHTFCHECTERLLPHGTCYACRSVVQQTIQLFI